MSVPGPVEDGARFVTRDDPAREFVHNGRRIATVTVRPGLVTEGGPRPSLSDSGAPMVWSEWYRMGRIGTYRPLTPRHRGGGGDGNASRSSGTDAEADAIPALQHSEIDDNDNSEEGEQVWIRIGGGAAKEDKGGNGDNKHVATPRWGPQWGCCDKQGGGGDAKGGGGGDGKGGGGG